MATFEERFIAELSRQCAGQDVEISNRVLFNALGWQKERFDSTRKALINKNIVQAAQGQKTRFVNVANAGLRRKAKSIFVSYSHRDSDMKQQLLAHLTPLQRQGHVKSWHDGMIKPGDRFAEVISSLWRHTSFGDIHAVNGAHAISAAPDRDAAYTQVAQDLYDLVTTT